MEDIAIIKLAYIAMTSLLAFIAASFFLLNPIRKYPGRKEILNSFSLFFLLSGLGFLTFVLSVGDFKILTIAINNICFLTSFLLLKQALIIRKVKYTVSILRNKHAIVLIISVPMINSLFYLYNPELMLIRTSVTIVALTTIVISTFKYIPINRKSLTFGEKIIKNTLLMSIVFMLFLLLVLLFNNNMFLYLTALTVTFTILLSSLLGAIQTLLMADLSNIYKQESITDFLTGMYNRRYFISRSNELVQLAKRKMFPFCIVIIDVDNFKKINDKYGHDIGDQVLKVISNIIKNNIRESDIAARIGGEEFSLTMPDTDAIMAMVVSERIRQGFQDESFNINGEEVFFRASFGISEVDLNVDGCVITHALKKADDALYCSKLNGKNRVSVFGHHHESTTC